MKKDIPVRKVEQLAVAIIPRVDTNLKDETDLWDVFIINLKQAPIKNVFISSKGYGEIDNEQRKTTTLRHFFKEIPPESAVQIEPIQQVVFQLTNEYWVSFTYEDYMYDKRYVFVIDSITSQNFTTVPIIQRKGVMIR